MKKINESALDVYFVYKFAKLISSPWKQWDAYETGVINKKGQVVKKHLSTIEEKESYTFFHRLVRNLKVQLEKIPAMKSKLGKAVTAYYLFKEELSKHGTVNSKIDEEFINYCNENMSLSESMQIEELMKQHILVENKNERGSNSR